MRVTIQRPDLDKVLAGTEKDIERAVKSGMRDAADGLKQDLREDVVAAGLGGRLSRTWRGKTFPEMGESAEAAAYVWSRTPKIVDAFDRGVVILRLRPVPGNPNRRRWQERTECCGFAREDHARQGWQRRTGLKLRFVYRRGRPCWSRMMPGQPSAGLPPEIAARPDRPVSSCSFWFRRSR